MGVLTILGIIALVTLAYIILGFIYLCIGAIILVKSDVDGYSELGVVLLWPIYLWFKWQGKVW